MPNGKYTQGKTDTETNLVVTVGFTTKVDHQTTSKIWYIFHGNSSHFIGLEEKKKEKSTTLGVRYIWRDAMCVPRGRKQEDKQQKEKFKNRKENMAVTRFLPSVMENTYEL